MAATVLVGIAVGVTSGLAAWWITARAITPKIELSEGISRLPDDGGVTAWLHRVKVLNVKRPWLPDAPLVDVRVTASLRIQGLRKGLPETWIRIRIPVGGDGELPIVMRSRVVRLNAHAIEEKYAPFLPPPLLDAWRERRLSLDDLFELGSCARLEVVIGASHSYTGARSTVVATYRPEDVTDGGFARAGLTVQPGTTDLEELDADP
jgi:hypothetical protein